MQELLKSFCFSEDKNGILLVDMPTGTGKSYNVIKFIYDNYKKVKNKVIFITNLKKNLPKEQLEEFFKKDNRLDDFEKDFLFLDNNVDSLIENFKNVKNDIPVEYFSKNEILSKVSKSIKIISTIKDNLEDSDKKVFEGVGSRDAAYFIMNQAKEDLQEKYEKEFRGVLEEYLEFDDDGKKRNKKQKLELINNDPKYKWIKVLYPAVCTDEKKIIFMSIDKFLVRNSTLVEPSYTIIDNLNFLNDSLLFIDEFDASKEVFLKSVIKESIDSQVGIVELFRIIYSGLENTDFSKMLTDVSSKLQRKIDTSGKKYYTPNEIISEFREKAQEINAIFNLKNFHKLDEVEKEKANFLFQDYKFHSIWDDNKEKIFFEKDYSNNINWVKRSKNISNIEKEGSVFLLLSQIKSFLTYFQNGIKMIADNYIVLKQDRKQETNNFSYEAAIKTVLSEFGLEGKYLNYLTYQIMNARKKRGYKIIDLKSDLDSSVYEKGFRFYNFIDSDLFDTQSKINYLSFDLTPEKILIYLCKNAKVVGISATGTLETVTGNYDLKYIKRKLNNSFYELNNEEKARIDKFIVDKLGDYTNVNIEIDKCEITQENYKDKVKYILDEEDTSFLENKNEKDNFVKARYTKLFYAFDIFFKKGIKSFLFITNKKMKNNSNFDYKFINDVFKKMKQKYNSRAQLQSLEGSLERFENTKNAIQNSLKAGENVFVVSTYQTLGAGQNLQYEFSERDRDDICLVNNLDYEEKNKDFDALFLDKPTNLFVSLPNNKTEDQLIKLIYQIKCLEEIGHLSLEHTEKLIKQSISFYYNANAISIKTPRSQHISMHVAKVVLQAVGRICRTQNKNRNIYIGFDCTMEMDLSKVKQVLLSRPLNHEMKALLNSCQNANEDFINAVENCNNSKAKKISGVLENLRKFKTQSDIAKWEELREIVLKYPTHNGRIHYEYDIYSELAQPSSYCYYANPSKDVYNITGQTPNSMIINEEQARLKELMLIPGVEEYFKSQNYATNFQKGKFILLPNVFTSIYLGALGETVGRFLVDGYLENVNLKLSRIVDHSKYEKFDFVFGDNCYVDFKHWVGAMDKERKAEVQRFINKLDRVNGRKGFIINILKPDNFRPENYVSPDERLIIIPYIYDLKEKKISYENLKLLLKVLK